MSSQLSGSQDHPAFPLLRLLQDEVSPLLDTPGIGELVLRATELREALISGSSSGQDVAKRAASMREWIASVHAVPNISNLMRERLCGIAQKIEELILETAR